MKTKSPADRRKFAGPWDEINYLRDKLLYWLYNRQDHGRSRPFAVRLQKLLQSVDGDHESILGEECWSLVFESLRDAKKAIQYRENEIRLIRRLHEVTSGLESKRIALKEYGTGDLCDRLELLASLYAESNNVDKAVAALQESQRLCHEHRLKFDGQQLLRDCLNVQGMARRNGKGVPLPTVSQPAVLPDLTTHAQS